METDNPFEKVLDRLREKGWRKFNLGREEGPNCINGAIWFTCGKSADEFTRLIGYTIPIVQDQYADRIYRNYPEIANPSFNNHPDTTFSDVERVLEKAAVKWEEERVLRHD